MLYIISFCIPIVFVLIQNGNVYTYTSNYYSMKIASFTFLFHRFRIITCIDYLFVDIVSIQFFVFRYIVSLYFSSTLDVVLRSGSMCSIIDRLRDESKRQTAVSYYRSLI